MTERQRQASWHELEERRRTVEARQTIRAHEAQLEAVEDRLGPAVEEEGRRRVAFESAGWRMVQAIDQRPPSSSLLVLAGDPERAELDQAEAALTEMTSTVVALQGRRARLRQHLAHLHAVAAG
jgi:hypothetical protein